MTNTRELTSWAKAFRRSIQVLTTLAAFIFSMISGFIEPLGFSDDERNAIVRFVPFILAVLIGAAFIMRRKWIHQSSTRWVLITVALLIASVLSWLLYWNLLSERTGFYDNQRVIVGNEYTDQAATYVSHNLNKPREELIGDYGGKIEMIWTRETINQSRIYIQATYLACIIFSTLCLLSLTQAMGSNDSVGGRKTKRTAAK